MDELKKELDEITSKYVRLSAADWKGDVHCYTCSWVGRWQDADAGHFIARGYLILRFELDNLRVQCRDCNRHKGGQSEIFEEELRWDVGDARVDEMLRLKDKEAHYDEAWYREHIVHIMNLVKTLPLGHTTGA